MKCYDSIPIAHIEIFNGNAVIRGRKLKAKLVASMHIKGSASIDDVMAQYDLSRAEVYAALAYYYDHQEAIERGFRNAEARAREVGISSHDLIEQLRIRGEKRE